MIILLTPQNTGTHFIADFLLRHSKIKRIVSEVDWLHGVGRQKLNRKAPTYEYRPLDLESCVLKKHIFGIDSHKFCDLLILGHKTIITLRDPLSSIISRKNRNPNESFISHVDVFEYIATSPHVKKNSLVVPIDTDIFKTNAYHRISTGKQIFDYCELTHEDYLHPWAEENSHHNSMGNYPEKNAYNCGDLEGATANCKKEYHYLKSKEDVIKPFMKKLGYHNTLWWEDD